MADDLATLPRGFRLMPGMLARYAPRGSEGRRWSLEAGTARQVRVLRVGVVDNPDAVLFVTADGEAWPSGAKITDCLSDDLVPVLDDPASLGCLLALVREAWDDPNVRTVVLSNERWRVWVRENSGDALRFEGDTEAEVLIIALDAADER